MPLTRLQSHILHILASKRSPESFVAGGIVLNRDGPRYSGDIDIFNDVAADLAATVEIDLLTLANAGLAVERLDPRSIYIARAVVKGLNDGTEIDWVFDSDFRFFPALKDDQFGYVLHPVDLAINKAAAAANRRVPRDIIDLLETDEHILPLGATLCAAVGRFPGPSPEGMLDDISRNSLFTPPEYADLIMERPITPAETYPRIRAMIRRAEAFIPLMPSDALGALYLLDEKAVQPDPAKLDQYVRHEGRRRGHWPSSSEIGSAMLERYVKK